MKDRETTIQHLKNIASEFSEKRDWTKFHNPKDLSIGIVTEGSELLAMFRFKSETEVKELLKSASSNEIRYELADILYFVLLFSHATGIDLSEAFREKMELNEQRYPLNKSRGSNKKYTEL